MLDATEASHANENETPTLQPMRFGDILDTIFSLYRNHLLLFLGIVAFYFFGSLAKYSLTGFFSDLNLRALLASIVQMPFALLSMGAIVVASATTYLGGQITSGTALRQALRRFWLILACHLLLVSPLVITFIGIFLSIPSIVVNRTLGLTVMIALIGIPVSIYVMVRWTFLVTTVLLEEPSVRYALKRSSELVRGAWWKVFGVLFCILLLGFAIHIILEISLGCILILAKLGGETDFMDIIQWSILNRAIDSTHLPFYVIMTCTDLVLNTLVYPIWFIGVTLLYFDRRIRTEGFDIEMIVDNRRPEEEIK